MIGSDIDEKRCPRCQKTLPLGQFKLHYRRPSGTPYYCWCKECARTYTRERTRRVYGHQSRNNVVDGMKRCRQCDVTKSVDQFKLLSKGSQKPGYGWCIECTARYAAEYSRLRRIDPDYIKKARQARIRRVYGLTHEQYEAMGEVQEGRCYLCRRKPDNPLHVDHDHRNGSVRRLLCIQCNAALGMIDDDPELADRLAAYIRAHRKEVRP